MGGAGEDITKCQDEILGSEDYVYYLVFGDTHTHTVFYSFIY